MKNVSFMATSLGLLVLVVLTTTGAASQAQGASTGANYTIHLPLVINLVNTDLAITGLEVTQSIQTPGNNIPLVAHRHTVVRVFAQTLVGEAPDNVTIALSATRNGVGLGTITIGPGLAPLSTNRGTYSSTFNAALPAEWLWGTVELVAILDPNNAIPEADKANNSMALRLNFNDVPPLDIKIVPINYRHSPTNVLYPAQQVDFISDWIRRAYPVSEVRISFHTPYNFTGDLRLGSEWSRLLRAVYDLKRGQGVPDFPQVWYGFVPINNGASQWFYSGISGIGYVGYRESVGLNLGTANDRSGILAGHEVGHNFGRYHAPCGGPGNPDVNYPHAGASIGEYGLDIRPPQFNLLSPGRYVDMMSYCSPAWVSDYTYRALYDNQRWRGQMTQAAPVASMMIRVQFSEAGEATLDPVYSFANVPSPEPAGSEYVIEILDAAGRVVAIHQAALREAEEEDVSVQALHAVVPAPAMPVALVRLLHAGNVVAERPLHRPFALATTATLSVAQTAESAVLAWGMPGIPAIVRYTTDDGQTWTTLAVDVLAGEMVVDTTTLPGGGHGRFEVILADSAEPLVLAAPLARPLSDRPPQTWITGPTELFAGQPVVLYGYGADAEDGSLVDLAWQVNGRPLATGSTLPLHELPPGEHLITLSARDSAGQVSQSGYVVTVFPALRTEP